jgi:hypothetical protein
MRSTVRIDDDLFDALRERARKKKLSLTKALNETLRAGLKSGRVSPPKNRHYREKTFSLGAPAVDLTKALALASRLEDDEVVRKARLRK